MAASEPELHLSLKGKGDLAELMVAADLLGRGYKIAIPYREDCDFDSCLSETTTSSECRSSTRALMAL